jgi:hypothetical protein
MRKMIIVLIGFIVAACGQNNPAVQPTISPQPGQPTQPIQPTQAPATPITVDPAQPGYPSPLQPYPAPSAPTGSIAAPAELVQAARGRLAAKLGVGEVTLSIQAGEAQQWPDESIGCPAPDVSYAQFTIPGFLLTFGDGTRSYAVHTSLAANPGEPMLWCENQLPIDIAGEAAPATADAQGQAMFELARQDLARQLNIDPATITLIAISAVDWNDSSLGCPQPGVNYMQVITPGYNMRLDAQGKAYEYHSDAKSAVVQCGP